MLAWQGPEIGCHTNMHIMKLPMRKLHEQLSQPPTLPYPCGGRDTVSERSRALVRKAGFVCCTCCFGAVNPNMGHAFDLNRISVGQRFMTPDHFALDLLLNRN